jgi:hypothetical protein
MEKADIYRFGKKTHHYLWDSYGLFSCLRNPLVVLIQYDLYYIDTLKPSCYKINFDVILYPRLRLYSFCSPHRVTLKLVYVWCISLLAVLTALAVSLDMSTLVLVCCRIQIIKLDIMQVFSKLPAPPLS